MYKKLFNAKAVPTLVKSISYSQSEILENILSLYVPDKRIECDPTFSKGVFYKQSGISAPKYCYDIEPQCSNVIKADARDLPLSDDSISCMILDPPFLATKGKSLKSTDGNIINKRFGVYPDEKSLHKCYIDMLTEAHRILNPNGILIFKCQDKVSSGKQYMSHVFVMNEAVKSGFYPEDLFILLAKNRIVANWQMKSQKHSRKFHSYFWVFRKCDTKIKYCD